MEPGIVYSHFCLSENLIIPNKEILRYMSCRTQDNVAQKLIDECLTLVTNSSCFKGSFICLPVECKGNEVLLADTCINSAALAQNLKGCHTAVIFALTLGLDIDMLIKKYSAKSTLHAFGINATATAAIEAYADMFCREISQELQKEALYTRPRFSPGYGDLPIQTQSLFLNLTNASRLLGITLTQKYMMMPSKSVTAIMGASPDPCSLGRSNCSICTQEQCNFKEND